MIDSVLYIYKESSSDLRQVRSFVPIKNIGTHSLYIMWYYVSPPKGGLYNNIMQNCLW